MRAALLQLTSSDDPEENLRTVTALTADAVAQGATVVATPEVTNCVSLSRTRQREVLEPEAGNRFLAGLQSLARGHGIWFLAGSLAIKTDDPEGRFANRSFLISPAGESVARYDKIHMFDVEISDTETYRESSGYRPGTRAVVARTEAATFGLSVCYDVRFAALYRALAGQGAQILTVPAAFSPVTGAAHWEVLLRARAIETGCFVIAPAQTGTHPAQSGKSRQTYGHSMVVAPWGEVLLDAGTEPGAYLVDLDLSSVDDARRRVPALLNARNFDGPE